MRFLSLANRNIKEIYRDPVSILLGVVMPPMLLILFSSIAKNAPLGMFTLKSLTPGVIVFSFGFLTMFSAMLLAKDRQSAFLTRLLVAPLKPMDFILAYTLPFIPIAILQIAISLTIAIVKGLAVDSGLMLILAILLITAVACIGIGMIFGSLLTEPQVAGAGSLVIVSISLFGGVWTSLDMMGGIFKTIGYALPFAHAIDAARAILQGSGFENIRSDLYWVIGYTVVLFLLGVLSFKQGTKQ